MDFLSELFEEREKLRANIQGIAELKENVLEIELKYLSLQKLHSTGRCNKNCLEIPWSVVADIKILAISLSNAYHVDLAVTNGDRHREDIQDYSLLSLAKIIFPIYKKVLLCHERHKRHFSD